MKKVLFVFVFAFTLLFSISISAKNLKNFEKELSECKEKYTLEEQKCNETWSMRCYNFLIDTNKKTQQCYKNTAIKMFFHFHNLSEKNAKTKIVNYTNFIYDEYLFLYNNTNYCVKNNCGISPYLYSEYTTTQELYNYVYKMIKSVSVHN